MNAALCCFLWFTPDVQYSIANGDIRPELGGAYQTTGSLGGQKLYSLLTDSAGSPTSSNLVLYEDGRALGPPHSLHAEIRESGRGRYSHWDRSIVFSSSDGTDPRTNGRTYSITGSTEVKPWLRRLLVTILAFADLAFFNSFLPDIVLLLRSKGALLLAGLGVAIVMFAALAAFDLFGRIIVAKEGLPKDAALSFHVLQHAVLGCLTSIGIWAAGAGLCRLMLRNPRAGPAEILIPAFPISLALLAVLLATALVIPWGRSIAFALWLLCLAPLRSWRPPRGQIAAVLKAALGIVPFAIAFGIWLALLWHGPTDTLSGSPTGDLTYYAGSIWSLASQAYPNIDPGYASGGDRGYFNSLYPALGAALLPLPEFDPFLFLLASGGTSYVLLSTLMLHLYVAERAAARPIGVSYLAILLLSILAAARYPYWVAESIPLVFVPALTISVWWMAERGRQAFGWSVAAMLAGLSGSLLSKIVTAAILVPLGSAGIWSRMRALPYPARLAVLGVGCIFGIYSAIMLIHFMPLFLAYSTLGPESLRTPRWYFVCRDAAALLMMALAWTTVDLPVALALCLGLTTFLIYSWVFQINFVCASIILGLIMVAGAPRPASVRILALLAFALSLPALVLGDQASASSGVIWIVCLGGAVLVATLSAVGTTAVPQLTLRTSASVAVTTLMVTGLGLIGVARGSIIADSGWHFVERERLTPELREIWSAVRERTPKDALIFTDQVDETENILGGWNTYAFSGQRQIFLSSYVTSPGLRYDKQKLREVLSINKSVLDGSRSPGQAPTQREYGSFYAVVSASHAAPAKWRLIFRNRQYALYGID